MKLASLAIRFLAVIGIVAFLFVPEMAQAHAVGGLSRVSVGPGGFASNGVSFYPVLSGNGRYLAFSSSATNLVEGDTNGKTDVFIRDLTTGENIIISKSAAGEQGNAGSLYPALSETGRYVAFISDATNLIDGDTNQARDVFWVDRDVDGDSTFDEPGDTSIARVSVASDGTQGVSLDAYSSESVAISGNGQYVAFIATFQNLVEGDTNENLDVFVHDRNTGDVRRLSVNSSGAEANQDSYAVSISPDGRLVAFYSSSTNLVEGDTNGKIDIFVYDRDTDTDDIYDEGGLTSLRIVSVNSQGELGNNHSGYTPNNGRSAVFSGNNQWIAFASWATNLVEPLEYTGTHVYLHNLETGETSLAAVSSSGEPEKGYSWSPALSYDGRFVTFISDANNLDFEATLDIADVYIRDRLEGKTYRVGYAAADNDSSLPVISSDGSKVAFSSVATNQVYLDSDTNGVEDIFLFEATPDQLDILISTWKTQLPGYPVTFTAETTYSSTLPITYTWTATGLDPITHTNVISHSDSATFTWPNPGPVTVTVQATNADGTFQDSLTTTIHDTIILDFTVDQTEGVAPFDVHFTNTSSCVGDCRYYWNFGDSGTGSTSGDNSNPIHRYTQPGVHSVSLEVIRIGPGVWDDITETKTGLITVLEPVVAHFTTDKTEGVAPLSIQFTDTSTGGASAWEWDFGDGTTSTDQNPSHTFDTPGSYSVTLTATGEHGTDTETMTINSYNPILASFSANLTEGITPLTVTFTNNSTGDGLSYDWDFGDGGVSDVENPVHVFNSGGVYTVRLTASASYGSDTATQTDYIVVHQRVAAGFSVLPSSGTFPLDVAFTNTTVGEADTWSWEFGDGGTSTDASPSHTYQDPGTYTVKLTASGPGGSNSTTKTINVYTPVQANFSKNKVNGIAPLSVSFTNLSTGDYTSLTWNFGDGSPTSSQTNPTHSYAAKGTYTVTLTATGLGGTNVSTQSIEVFAPVRAAFSADRYSGVFPLAVQFTNGSSGDYTSLTWSFGDESPPSSDENPTHSYSTTGTYTVTLTATGPGGTHSTPHTIQVYTPVNAGFTTDPANGVTTIPVSFTNISTGYTSLAWDFGDGSPTSSQTNPSHTYALKGSYVVKLTAIGPGGTDEITHTIEVYAKTQSSIIADRYSGPSPLTVQFTNGSSGDYSTQTWDFGDGSPENTDEDPSHTYSAPGNYTVTLTIIGPGGTSSSTKTIEVQKSVTASFTAGLSVGIPPFVVSFDNSSAGPYDTCSWDFGDGSTSTECSPDHTYTKAGTYTVTLTISGAGGVDTLVREDYIVQKHPTFLPVLSRTG